VITNPGNKTTPPKSVVQIIPANGGEEEIEGFTARAPFVAVLSNFILEKPSIITGLEVLAYQTLSFSEPPPTESTLNGLFVRIYKDVDNDGLDADDPIVFGNTNTSNPILSDNILTNTFRTGGFRVQPHFINSERRPLLAAQAAKLHIDLSAGSYFIEYQLSGVERFGGPFVPPVYPSIAPSSMSGLPGPTCCRAGFGLQRFGLDAVPVPAIQRSFGSPSYEYQATFPFQLQGFQLPDDVCIAIGKSCPGFPRPGGINFCCDDEAGAPGQCVDEGDGFVCISG